MKITLVAKRDVDFVGQNGEQVKGFMYIGYLQNGNPVEFFSQDADKPILKGGIGFDGSAAIEVNLEPRISSKTGRIKYKENSDF